MKQNEKTCDVDDALVGDVFTRVMDAVTPLMLERAHGQPPNSATGKMLTASAVAALLGALAGMTASAELSPEEMVHAAQHAPNVVVVRSEKSGADASLN